ncbi:hypothetical protein CPB84DRAFT_1763623, partial [Gymnopilus junonius]
QYYFLHLGLHVLPDLLTFSLVFFIFAFKYFTHVNTDPNSNVMLSANDSTSTCYVEIGAQQHNPNWTDYGRLSCETSKLIPKLYSNINPNSRKSTPALELDITVPKYPGIEQDMQPVGLYYGSSLVGEYSRSVSCSDDIGGSDRRVCLNESSSENAEDLAYARPDDTSGSLDFVHHFHLRHLKLTSVVPLAPFFSNLNFINLETLSIDLAPAAIIFRPEVDVARLSIPWNMLTDFELRAPMEYCNIYFLKRFLCLELSNWRRKHVLLDNRSLWIDDLCAILCIVDFTNEFAVK